MHVHFGRALILDELILGNDPGGTSNGPIQHAVTDEYLDWNDALAEHFFNPSEDNKRIFLFVSNDTISAVAAKLQRLPASFVDVVKTGPPLGHQTRPMPARIANFRGLALAY